MDREIAEIYGTDQLLADDTDQEKTAAAELLVKLAEEQGVDLNDFSDEEVAEMISDLYGGQGIEHTAEAQQAEFEAQQLELEAQEKVAEADYLGRIMAHSYVQELSNIEKAAAEAPPFPPKKEKADEEEEKKEEKKAMDKAAAVFDDLAQQRAFEMAKEAGYIDDVGNLLVDTQVKEASALDFEVERRALEICEANGIPVEWNE